MVLFNYMFTGDMLETIFNIMEHETAVVAVIESFAIAFTPLIMYRIFMKKNYCEGCGKQYKSETLLTSKDASPYIILEQLRNMDDVTQISPPHSDSVFPKYQDQKRVDVKVYYCPVCFDAIVDGVLIYNAGFGGDDHELLFYSDFWPGSRFKQLYQSIKH